MEIPLKPFPNSGNIAQYGYDKPTKTLRVEFKSGSTYDYAGVPAKIVEEIEKAPSVGGVISAKVIKAGFKATKLEVAEE
jgi:hypothetical protein